MDGICAGHIDIISNFAATRTRWSCTVYSTAGSPILTTVSCPTHCTRNFVGPDALWGKIKWMRTSKQSKKRHCTTRAAALYTGTRRMQQCRRDSGGQQQNVQREALDDFGRDWAGAQDTRILKNRRLLVCVPHGDLSSFCALGRKGAPQKDVLCDSVNPSMVKSP